MSGTIEVEFISHITSSGKLVWCSECCFLFINTFRIFIVACWLLAVLCRAGLFSWKSL